MKNKYTLAIIIFLVLIIAFGYYHKQNEHKQISGVRYYNTQDYTNLALLCKVWGYVKYYHPSVVDGKYNWDDELVKMLPLVLKSKNKDERNQILAKWISQLDDFEQGTLPEIDSDSIKMYPDLNWIKNYKELGTLSNQLELIKTAQRDFKEDRFIQYEGMTIRGEAAYTIPVYPPTEYRLLALFRFWNVIQYYFHINILLPKIGTKTLKISYLNLLMQEMN